MKKIQIPVCGNAELTVRVTEQMEKELADGNNQKQRERY